MPEESSVLRPCGRWDKAMPQNKRIAPGGMWIPMGRGATRKMNNPASSFPPYSCFFLLGFPHADDCTPNKDTNVETTGRDAVTHETKQSCSDSA